MKKVSKKKPKLAKNEFYVETEGIVTAIDLDPEFKEVTGSEALVYFRIVNPEFPNRPLQEYKLESMSLSVKEAKKYKLGQRFPVNVIEEVDIIE